jgi:cysteinyl-tRNA synthetase
MNVFGIDLAQEGAAAGDYPAEVVDLAAKVAGYAGSDAHEAVDALLEARTKARAEKNFAVADAVRDGLTDLGFTVEDTPQGPRVTFGD